METLRMGEMVDWKLLAHEIGEISWYKHHVIPGISISGLSRCLDMLEGFAFTLPSQMLHRLGCVRPRTNRHHSSAMFRANRRPPRSPDKAQWHIRSLVSRRPSLCSNWFNMPLSPFETEARSVANLWSVVKVGYVMRAAFMLQKVSLETT